MSTAIDYCDEEQYPDSIILTTVFKLRGLTLKADYNRHKWKVIRMLIGIDRYDSNLMLTCVSWMNRLKTLMQKASVEV